MRPTKYSGAVIKGALALTMAALITKILSAIYRVPFQNIVGDVGFYIYQQVYPLYALALVLSTYGFPVVISKLYMERKNNGDKAELKRLLVVSGTFIFLLCIAAFLLLYFGAEGLAAIMGDPDLVILIKVVAAVFLLIPFISVFRGYFQGSENMVPTAYSQVTEQFIRVGTILTASAVLLTKGYDLYRVGAGAVFGSITGGLAGLLILAGFIWHKKAKEESSPVPLRDLADPTDIKMIIKALALHGFAICISNMLLIFVQLADSLNLYSLLLSTGMDAEEAKSLKGVYDRGQPLIQLGAVVATSMSLTLVPFITNAKMKKNSDFLHKHIKLSLEVSLIIGLGAAVGLLAIMEPTNILLFENSKGSDVLQVVGLVILPASLIITVVAILQGLGSTFFPAIVVLGGFAVKYGLNELLVPLFGIVGAASASNAALWLVLFVLSIKFRMLHIRSLFSGKFLVVLVAAAIIMYAVLELFLSVTGFAFGESRTAAGVQALSAVVLGGLTYLFTIIRGKVFTMEELSILPFASKFKFLFSRRNRR